MKVIASITPLRVEWQHTSANVIALVVYESHASEVLLCSAPIKMIWMILVTMHHGFFTRNTFIMEGLCHLQHANVCVFLWVLSPMPLAQSMMVSMMVTAEASRAVVDPFTYDRIASCTNALSTLGNTTCRSLEHPREPARHIFYFIQSFLHMSHSTPEAMPILMPFNFGHVDDITHLSEATIRDQQSICSKLRKWKPLFAGVVVILSVDAIQLKPVRSVI